MLLEPKKAELVVMACIYLHNFLRKERSSRDIYSPTDLFDNEIEGKLVRGTWREDIQSYSAFTPMERVGRSPRFAEENRNEFAEYFSTIGAVPSDVPLEMFPVKVPGKSYFPGNFLSDYFSNFPQYYNYYFYV